MTSMRNTSCRSVEQAPVVFLFKLHSGNSNAIVTALLGLNRKQQVSEFYASVLNAF